MRIRHGVVAAGAALVLLAGTAWTLTSAARKSSAAGTEAAAAPVVTVKTLPITRSNLVHRITTFGEVGSGQVIGMSFPRPGQITRLVLTAGQHVTRGTVLATLAA